MYIFNLLLIKIVKSSSNFLATLFFFPSILTEFLKQILGNIYQMLQIPLILSSVYDYIIVQIIKRLFGEFGLVINIYQHF